MRNPRDFDTLCDSTLWSTNGRSELDGVRVSITFIQGYLAVCVLQECDCDDTDCERGVSTGLLTTDGVAELAEQLDAWLAWKRGCGHRKFARTNRCGEMGCWNYAAHYWEGPADVDAAAEQEAGHG